MNEQNKEITSNNLIRIKDEKVVDTLNGMYNGGTTIYKTELNFENEQEKSRPNSDEFKRLLNGREAGICLIASTELARNATRQPGGDRVRQRCCPRIYDMREIPQNDNKKALFPECLICLAEKKM